MLLIYSEHTSPRLEYIVTLFFSELLNVSHQLTTDRLRYINYEGPKINYSTSPLEENDCFWAAHGLLSEQSVKPVENIFQVIDGKKVFFPVRHENSIQNFDPFAAAFYFVTRYEEYFPFEPDAHGRFEAKESVLYKTESLLTPLVNKWATDVIDIIREKYPMLEVRKPTFKITVTVDIDQAYDIRYKNSWRLASKMIRNSLSGRFNENSTILKTARGIVPDTFDSYQYISKSLARTGVSLVYFINLGKHSKFDKNISNKKALQQLMHRLESDAGIGIHPSYYSNEQPKLFAEEIGKLQALTNKSVTKSRQHYLRLALPETYRHLTANGIKEDYSMGYASYPGFRAGTCSEFNWFDLEKNECTDLRIKPVTWMEGTFAEDLSLSPGGAWLMMKKLLHTVYEYNGHFIPIWHNHTIAESGLYKGWRQVFELMLNEIECIPYEKKENCRFSHQ